MTPLVYAGSSVSAALVQLVAGFVIIRWVAPQDFGLWNSVRLAQVYAFFLLLGINNGLSRELPFFLGKTDTAFSERLLSTALFCTTIASALVLIGGIACAGIFLGKGPGLVYAILAVTLTIAASFFQNIFICTFRSMDSFKTLSIIQFVNAGFSLASILLVYFFHYEGMLARAVITAVVGVGLMFVFLPMRAGLSMDKQALKVLIKTGAPIFGLDYIANCAGTLDRLVLLKIGGVIDVGYYTLASAAVGLLQVLPQSLASYIYPRMTYKYGQNADAPTLWRLGIRFALFAVTITALTAAFGFMVLPRFVMTFAPRYSGGIRAAQIVLIAGAFDGLCIVANALWSMKAWRLMTIYQTLSSVTYGAGPLLGCFVVGPSLEGVAWGVVMGFLARSLLAVGLTYYGTHRPAPAPEST